MRENVIRKRIRFYGRVQGVGFRYYAYRGAYIRIDSADVRDIPVVEDERKFRTRY